MVKSGGSTIKDKIKYAAIEDGVAEPGTIGVMAPTTFLFVLFIVPMCAGSYVRPSPPPPSWACLIFFCYDNKIPGTLYRLFVCSCIVDRCCIFCIVLYFIVWYLYWLNVTIRKNRTTLIFLDDHWGSCDCRVELCVCLFHVSFFLAVCLLCDAALCGILRDLELFHMFFFF